MNCKKKLKHHLPSDFEEKSKRQKNEAYSVLYSSLRLKKIMNNIVLELISLLKSTIPAIRLVQ